MPSRLPAGRGAFVYAKVLGQLPPRQAERLARRGKLFPRGLAGWEGVVIQEPDNAWEGFNGN